MLNFFNIELMRDVQDTGNADGILTKECPGNVSEIYKFSRVSQIHLAFVDHTDSFTGH